MAENKVLSTRSPDLTHDGVSWGLFLGDLIVQFTAKTNWVVSGIGECCERYW